MTTLLLTLFVLSCVSAVHAICTANAMSKHAPLSVALEIVLMFGFSVGAAVSCWNAQLDRAIEFLLIAVVAKAIAIVDMLCRGYPIKFSLITCATFHYPDEKSS